MTNKTKTNNLAQLYLVATPIGNLQDISPRAIDTLKSCDLILAEDTRHSIVLLKKFNITTPLKSYHLHNERQRVDELLDFMNSGKTVALISDAGMPVISDPGYILVKAAYMHNYKVSVIPGPCAVSCAVAISGIDCTSFTFVGFLPSKDKQRTSKLEELKQLSSAIVAYESPHRIVSCLENIVSVYGVDHIVSVIKEISKQYETVYHGKVANILNQLSRLGTVKGEFVIVISRIDSEILKPDDKVILDYLNILQKEGVTAKQAIKVTSKLLGVNKNNVYELSLKTR